MTAPDAARSAPVPVSERRFRASPHYAVVPAHGLSPEERRLLGAGTTHPHLFGVLRPRSPAAVGPKAIGRDVAALLLTLGAPGPIPRHVTERLGEGACERAVGHLVLDGIVEVEDDGRFVSGVEAAHLFARDPDTLVGSGPLAELSLRALQSAESLGGSDPAAVARHLYRFHAAPATPRWRRRLPTDDAVATFLGLERFGHTRWIEDAGAAPASRSDGHWRHWRLPSPPAPGVPGTRDGGYKLYVSPRLDALPDALHAVFAVAPAHGASGFKTGKDLYGLQRPDKLVVYLPTFDRLQALAAQLAAALAGVPVHGVPFTAALDGDGLLSWGMDPPRDRAPGPRTRESWRRVVTDRLAVALVGAHRAPAAPLPPHRFALARLAAEGIDVTTWSPHHTIWEREHGDH